MTERSLVVRLPETNGELVEATALVRDALSPGWQFGGHAIVQAMTDALLAFGDGELLGALALHGGPPATINVVAVRTRDRRQGVGSALVEAACVEFRRRGASEVGVAGGGPYLWPGIPRDLPGALAFFVANGWRCEGDTHDLTRALVDFSTPPHVAEGARKAGIVFRQAALSERDWLAAHALEHWYRRWDEYFAASAPDNVLVGHRCDGQLVAALIVGFPGQPVQWQPMLGPQVTTIGCVGTLRAFRGQGIGTALVAAASEMLRRAGGSVCHIGWSELLTFYGRLGYMPWRTYGRATRSLHTT